MKLIADELELLTALYDAKSSVEKAIQILEEDTKISADNIQDQKLKIILTHVANYFSVSVVQLRSKSKKRELVNARHIFFKLAKDNLPDRDVSLQKIADVLNKDHATVLHGIKNIVNSEFTKDMRWYDYLNINEMVTKDLKDDLFEEKTENGD